MKDKWKIALSCFLVLSLSAALFLGCSTEEKEGGEPEIVLGRLTDLTGPAAASLVEIGRAVQDIVNYVNEENPIPGAKLKLINYDTKYDSSRYLTGYEWLKDKGAELIFSPLSSVGEILKDTLATDKVVLVSQGASIAQIDPPGWVFLVHSPVEYQTAALAKWIADEHWDYDAEGRKPKVGSVGWLHPYGVSMERGFRTYAQDNPDKFEWVVSALASTGTMTWSGEVQELKDCDYVIICAPGIAPTTFMAEFRDREYAATFLGTDSSMAFKTLYVNKVGWDGLDGFLTTGAWRWWNTASTQVDLAKTLLYDNHSQADADATVAAGISYLGGFQALYLLIEILREAVAEVGAENFNGQAYYNAAVKYETQWQGYPEFAFSQTDRVAAEEIEVFEWSATEEDLVVVRSFMPVVEIE